MHTRWWTTQPAAAHLASVPPAPNSTSSGWAPIARATPGRRGRRRVDHAATSRSARLSGLVRSHAGSSFAATGWARSAGCRCRGRAGIARAPRPAARSASASARWRAERRRRRRRREAGVAGTASTFVPSPRRSGTSVSVAGGADGEVVGEREVAVGHDDVVEPLAGDRRPAGVDRAVEPEPRAPQHAGARSPRPTRPPPRRRTRRTPAAAAPPATTRSASQRGQLGALVVASSRDRSRPLASAKPSPGSARRCPRRQGRSIASPRPRPPPAARPVRSLWWRRRCVVACRGGGAPT